MKARTTTIAALVSAAIAATALIVAPGAGAKDGQVIYEATLAPLNATVAKSSTTGTARFTIAGDKLTIAIDVKGAPPGMEHLQHFHGFARGTGNAKCPTEKDDSNMDGIIDIVETEPVAGTTMVPFHDDPVSLAIVNDTYPKAGSDGAYAYSKIVSLHALQQAFAKKFNGQKLDLARRVVFIHGIPRSTKLPTSVHSLDDIPAQVTLPIACGKIHKVEG
jgi:hypothetical protein